MKGSFRYTDTQMTWNHGNGLEVCSESAGFSATGTDRTPTCADHPNLLSGISLNELLILEKTTVTPHGITKSAAQGPNSGNSSKEFNSGNIIR